MCAELLAPRALFWFKLMLLLNSRHRLAGRWRFPFLGNVVGAYFISVKFTVGDFSLRPKSRIAH
jgi:hypothetical protein